jgi:hypothetical protein
VGISDAARLLAYGEKVEREFGDSAGSGHPLKGVSANQPNLYHPIPTIYFFIFVVSAVGL